MPGTLAWTDLPAIGYVYLKAASVPKGKPVGRRLAHHDVVGMQLFGQHRGTVAADLLLHNPRHINVIGPRRA